MSRTHGDVGVDPDQELPDEPLHSERAFYFQIVQEWFERYARSRSAMDIERIVSQ